VYNAGDFNTTETVIIPINTFDSNDPTTSVTVTNLAAGDVEIHKDGSTTQRASDSGVTVSIDFDGVTGNHIISIDLSDNTDAGFYSAGSRYLVRVEGITVDGGTINAWVGGFSIGCTLRPTTDGRTLDVTATGAAGIDWANVENQGTSVDLSATAIDLCDEVTSNTDMRGTDSAALASVCTESRLSELDAANLPADIDNILTDTGTTLPSTLSTIDGKIDTIDTNVDSVLTDTGTTLPAQISGLENISSSDVETACGSALTTYDPPTRAEATSDKAEIITEVDANETKIDTIDTIVDAILVDTNELQADWTNGGRLDLLIDAIKAATDLLNTAQTEPTGVPAANENPMVKLAYMFMAFRNKMTVTSTKKTYYDDSDNAEFEKDLSDDGTTYTESEINTV
jgi:hypothetical protein